MDSGSQLCSSLVWGLKYLLTHTCEGFISVPQTTSTYPVVLTLFVHAFTCGLETLLEQREEVDDVPGHVTGRRLVVHYMQRGKGLQCNPEPQLWDPSWVRGTEFCSVVVRLAVNPACPQGQITWQPSTHVCSGRLASECIVIRMT